jgi:hypothetical protein
MCYENRSERLPRDSDRDKKRKRKLPESRNPCFRASDAPHVESGNMCATSIRAFEVHIRLDTLDILSMSACSAKASFTALLSYGSHRSERFPEPKQANTVIFIAPQPLSFAKIPIFSKHLTSLLTHHQA